MSVKLKQKLKSVANLEKSISLILSSQKVLCQWGTTVSFVPSNIVLLWRKMQTTERR